MLQIKKQISIIDICKKSEETKLEMYTNTLNNHKNGYEALFKKGTIDMNLFLLYLLPWKKYS